MIVGFDSFKRIKTLMRTFFNKCGPEFILFFNGSVLMMISHMFENILSGVLNFGYVDGIGELILFKKFGGSGSMCSIEIWPDTDGERFSIVVVLLFLFEFL